MTNTFPHHGEVPSTLEALQNQLDTIGQALDSSNDGFAIWKLAKDNSNITFSLVLMNKAGANFAGESQPQILGRDLSEIVDQEVSESLRKLFIRALNLKQPITEVVPSKSLAGATLYFENTVVPFGNDLVFVTYRDVTEATRERTRLLWLTEHDYLTGIPNRAMLQATLAESIEWARDNGGLLSFTFIDIDYFKTVNDKYGHDVGDALLVNFVKRIRNSLPQSAMVARISGDEFAILLTNLKGESQLAELMDEVFSAMERPFSYGDFEMEITCSAGCVLTNGSVEPAELIKLADQAMYQAKREGRNRYLMETRTKAI